MSRPIDNVHGRYTSAAEHLKAIEDAIIEEFELPETARAQVKKAVALAFNVGHRTTTTDDWCG